MSSNTQIAEDFAKQTFEVSNAAVPGIGQIIVCLDESAFVPIDQGWLSRKTDQYYPDIEERVELSLSPGQCRGYNFELVKDGEDDTTIAKWRNFRYDFLYPTFLNEVPTNDILVWNTRMGGASVDTGGPAAKFTIIPIGFSPEQGNLLKQDWRINVEFLYDD